jgi:hypothetical protein
VNSGVLAARSFGCTTTRVRNYEYDRYRLLRRGNRFYAVDRQTNTRESLGTEDRSTATKLLNARNETHRCASLNLALGRIYYSAHDPALVQRTWEDVMTEFCRRGKEHTHERRSRAMKSRQFASLRQRKLVETNADQLREIIRQGAARRRAREAHKRSSPKEQKRRQSSPCQASTLRNRRKRKPRSSIFWLMTVSSTAV